MAKSKVRPEFIQRALESFQGLMEVLTSMTEEEVLYALELESQSLRRSTVLRRLILRAGTLQSARYKNELRKKYHAS